MLEPHQIMMVTTLAQGKPRRHAEREMHHVVAASASSDAG